MDLRKCAVCGGSIYLSRGGTWLHANETNYRFGPHSAKPTDQEHQP
jgi:hypothetical protein